MGMFRCCECDNTRDSDNGCEECSQHNNGLTCSRCIDNKSEITSIEKAKQQLNYACSLYCTWYEKGEPCMNGGSMAYELVSLIRKALRSLNK